MVSGVAPPGSLKSKRSRPRPKNRANYVRNHQNLREEGELSPEAEVESIADTLPVDYLQAVVPREVVDTLVVLGVSGEIIGKLRRWIVKPPSSKRFVDLSDTRITSSQSVHGLSENRTTSFGRKFTVETDSRGKRTRLVVEQNLENHAALSSVFSLESSRLFKRHLSYAAQKSKLRSWDLNKTGVVEHNVNSEDSFVQCEGASFPPPLDKCPTFVEEPSGSA